MSIPFACQDWANTKAAYRFLDNENVSESEILEGHFQSTAERFAATEPSLRRHSYSQWQTIQLPITSKIKLFMGCLGSWVS